MKQEINWFSRRDLPLMTGRRLYEDETSLAYEEPTWRKYFTRKDMIPWQRLPAGEQRWFERRVEWWKTQLLADPYDWLL